MTCSRRHNCFPLYLYDAASDEEESEDSLFAKKGAKDAAPSHTRRDGISDAGLAHFQAAYPTKGEGDTITNGSLFYYIYGLLHSPDYRTPSNSSSASSRSAWKR